MPDGRQQEPGGWNRVLLQVQDLPARIADLKEAGLRFKNEMEVGPGGKQIQIEDLHGNPIVRACSPLRSREQPKFGLCSAVSHLGQAKGDYPASLLPV